MNRSTPGLPVQHQLSVLEQFLTVLPGEIQARVREQQPESGEEAVVLVEGLQR